MIFRRMHYGKPVRNAVYAFTETFWRKRFFWKVTIVWIVSEYEWHLMAECLKLPSKCPVEHFDEKLFFGETSFFWWGVHTLGKIFLGFHERIGRIVKRTLFVSDGTCWRKSGLLEKILRFSLNLDFEQKNYTAGVLNLCPRCPEQIFDEKFCFFEFFRQELLVFFSGFIW